MSPIFKIIFIITDGVSYFPSFLGTDRGVGLKEIKTLKICDRKCKTLTYVFFQIIMIKIFLSIRGHGSL